MDGTDRLCRALYGAAKPADYLGGSDAKMLHDAADRIAELLAADCIECRPVSSDSLRRAGERSKRTAPTRS
jgi:hypothetical protein